MVIPVLGTSHSFCLDVGYFTSTPAPLSQATHMSNPDSGKGGGEGGVGGLYSPTNHVALTAKGSIEEWWGKKLQSPACGRCKLEGRSRMLIPELQSHTHVTKQQNLRG